MLGRWQAESVGLRLREIEQVVIATFLHSQPAGRSAKTRDLKLLIGPCRTDKIELEKGLGSVGRGTATGLTTPICRTRKVSCRLNGGWAIVPT